tara:strand:+ start:547 stop:912 length:366 start_codon:yes stop_codon:yes gene_type:complete
MGQLTHKDKIYIIATPQFTSSALSLLGTLRGYTNTITEWTASSINYLAVDRWYFSGSFSQSKAVQSAPQTVGYEIVCGQGRKAEWAHYGTNPLLGSHQGVLNTITSSIKTIRAIGEGHNPL